MVFLWFLAWVETTLHVERYVYRNGVGVVSGLGTGLAAEMVWLKVCAVLW